MTTASSLSVSSRDKLRAFCKTWLLKVVDAWFAIQLAHYGGKYSIERMLALEEYTRETSLTRAVLINIGTPLVVVTAVLLQEVFRFRTRRLVGKPTTGSGFALGWLESKSGSRVLFKSDSGLAFLPYLLCAPFSIASLPGSDKFLLE
ncbi:hypothetical protein ON010_g2907 [Phytophthora cinnamomi]|nr:hypothetical protein ON010_g2907 [Phytophthora cinnamomi]